MRRRAGVLGLVIAVLAVLWWWHGSRETKVPKAASKAAITAVSRDPHAQAKNATLSGRVTRAKDGAPLAAAYVALAVSQDLEESSESVLPLLVTTSADGRWTTTLAAGTYNVGVVADGYLPARRSPVLVVAHAAAEVNVALSEGGVVIRGVVSDIGGGPIGGARVSSDMNGTYIASFTRADGSYRLGLDPGFHNIAYSHDDYLTSTTSLSLETVDALHDVTMVPSGTIRGIVVARDTGKAVANAVITAPASRPQVFGEAETDANGIFVLHRVGAGDVSLYATAAGYVTTRPTVVNLGIGESVDARLVADHGFSLRGHITRVRHPTEGVAGVFVDAHTDAAVPDSRSRVATDRDGAFEIVGLAPARYTLTATGHDILDASRPDVVVAHDVDDLRIEVTSGVTLRGRIDPPEQVQLSVLSVDGYEAANVAHISEDASGLFTATNVPAGRIMISASSHTRAGEVTVHVGTSDQSGIVIALRTLSTKVISGTVVDESNTPVPRAYVDTVTDSTFASDDGTFELGATGPTSLYATFGVGDHVRRGEPIMRLDVDRDIHGLVVKIPATRGDIRGRVTGADGKPAGDVWISAETPPVLTGADGSFVITPLRSGSYDVHANSARGDASAVLHKVATGSTIEIPLQATATIHGRVTLAGAAVTHYELRCDGADYYERRIDAADGTFSFEHAHAGERPLECRAATAEAEGHATVAFAGAYAQVEIELMPFATVTGTVLDVFTNQPIREARVSLAGHPLGSLFTTDHTVAANGRFEIDHVPTEDVRIFVQTKRTFAEASAHPMPGHTVDVGTILMIPMPQDPADLEIYVGDNLSIRWFNMERYPELHQGDTIVAINGVATSAMPGARWYSLLGGSAERGHTYALTLARGVTVNVTAE